MAHTRFITAYCGHTSTEEYLGQRENFLECCAKCWRKTGQAAREAARATLEETRRDLSVWCDTCQQNVLPLEDAKVVLGVFWKTLDREKARQLTLVAHQRHEHSNYDETRTRLEVEGRNPKEARNIARGLPPDWG